MSSWRLRTSPQTPPVFVCQELSLFTVTVSSMADFYSTYSLVTLIVALPSQGGSSYHRAVDRHQTATSPQMRWSETSRMLLMGFLPIHLETLGMTGTVWRTPINARALSDRPTLQLTGRVQISTWAIVIFCSNRTGLITARASARSPDKRKR